MRAIYILGDVYELEKGLRPICTSVMWWNDVCMSRALYRFLLDHVAIA